MIVKDSLKYKYQDSGIKWIKKVPATWDIKPLLYCAQENTSKNSIDNKSINVLSLSYGKIILKNVENGGLSPENYNTYQVLNSGDIVMRLTDLQNDHVSLRTGLVTLPGIITSAYLGLKLRKEIVNERYFYWLLHSYDLQKVFYSMGGGVRQSIGFSDLKWLPILIPDLETQKRIADFLDEKTKTIDNLITKKQKLIQLLLRKREILIKTVVTKGLDSKVKLKKSGTDWIEKIPEDWEMLPLKYLFTYQVGGVWGNEALQNEEDIICVRVADFDFINLKVNSDDYTYRNISDIDQSLLLNSHSIILEKSGGGDTQPVGRAVRYLDKEKATFSNFTQKLQLHEKYNPGYVTYLLSAMYFVGETKKAIKQTTGIQNLDLSYFLRTNIFLPSSDEQKEIVDFLDEKNQKIIESLRLTEGSISNLKKYRSALIYATVTGKTIV